MVFLLRRTATLVSCIALLVKPLNSPAFAGTAADHVSDATNVIRRQPLTIANSKDSYSFAGLSYIEGFGREWVVVGFYYLEWTPAAPRDAKNEFVARMIGGNRRDKIRERWTSAASCPALLLSLKGMTTLQSPLLAELPGPLASEKSKSELPAIRFDPSLWRIWGAGREERTAELIDAELETTGPSTIGQWAISTLNSLKPCWKEKRPL
jgi:hypothetical protein